MDIALWDESQGTADLIGDSGIKKIRIEKDQQIENAIGVLQKAYSRGFAVIIRGNTIEVEGPHTEEKTDLILELLAHTDGIFKAINTRIRIVARENNIDHIISIGMFDEVDKLSAPSLCGTTPYTIWRWKESLPPLNICSPCEAAPTQDTNGWLTVRQS